MEFPTAPDPPPEADERIRSAADDLVAESLPHPIMGALRARGLSVPEALASIRLANQLRREARHG